MKRAVSAPDLRALRDKYERMFALREAHLRARSDPAFVEPDPRAELARLAEEFPGALREIDRLPLELIVRRIEALESAELHPSNVERWMIAQVTFHRYARGVLVTKRWLAGRRAVTPALRASFARAVAVMPRGGDAQLVADDLELIARPPGGRLMDLVHLHVARVLDVTEAEARALVFGAPRAR